MHGASFILVIVGALNWLLVGLSSRDILAMIGLGSGSIARIIYILIGLGGIYILMNHKKDCKMCVGVGAGAKPM